MCGYKDAGINLITYQLEEQMLQKMCGYISDWLEREIAINFDTL